VVLNNHAGGKVDLGHAKVLSVTHLYILKLKL
jgi:hypothetical protein